MFLRVLMLVRSEYIQSESIHKYRIDRRLATSMASMKVRGRSLLGMRYLSLARLASVRVRILEVPQQWLRVAYTPSNFSSLVTTTLDSGRSSEISKIRVGNQELDT